MARMLAILAASCLAFLGGPPAAADPAPGEPSSPVAEGPVSSADLPPEAVRPPATSELAPATSSLKAEDVPAVKEVTLDPTAKPPVCHRYVPTGSRIATERCHSAELADAGRDAERDQTRRDIDELRARQAMRDQARTAAQAEALRRRAGF
jgi:hypothetical protein